MKSKLLSVLLAGLFSMALQAEAAMVQWTFSGVLQGSAAQRLPFTGSFVYDTEERVDASGYAYHNFSNFMFNLNGVNMSMEDGHVAGYINAYGLYGMNYNYELYGISSFNTYVRNSGHYDTLSMPSNFSSNVYFEDFAQHKIYRGRIDLQGRYVNNVSAVPLPASALLFAPAALGVFGLRRKENS